MPPVSTDRPSAAPLRGLAAGLAAGLVAALAMDLFQKGWSRVLPPPSGAGDPATVKAAQRVRRAATGRYFASEDKAAAGGAVHYLFGAALGGAYGLAAEYRREVTSGGGSLFGAASSTLDELGVPLAGLGPAPGAVDAATHGYAVASHVVFGMVTEGVRRVLRGGDQG